jgi:hypothetical protein
MFWKKKSSEPKTKVKDIPDEVGVWLVVECKENPDWVWKLKAVVRQWQENRNVFNIMVFDEFVAMKSDVKVTDFADLEEHPELILYEGWYCRDPAKVQLKKTRALDKS